MPKLNFKTLLDINKEIHKIDENIVDIRLKITSPQSQIISDMPRGQSLGNSIENGIMKIEQLEERKLYLIDLITTEWLVCERVFNECNIEHECIELMRYRYFFGLSWRNCKKAMAKAYPQEEWNDNKLFRIHRQVVSICTKNGAEIC